MKLPKQAAPRNVYLTAAQLDMLASEAGPYRSLVLLLGVGGLRWGEAIALRVCDIDFLRRRIALHRNVVRVRSQFVVGSRGPPRRAATSVLPVRSRGSQARWGAARRPVRRSPE